VSNELQQFADHLNELGDMLSTALNAMVGAKAPNKRAGFFLLVFPLANPGTPVTFLSDGASPDQIIDLLEEATRRLKHERDQPKGHA
jgi:hypothetical protein